MYYKELLDMMFFTLIICGVFDLFLFLLTGNKARWFKLHTCINSLIVGLTIDNVYMIICDPQCGFDEKTNNIDGVFTVALHIYHCLFFKLKTIDYYHHGISVFLPIIIMPSINYRFNSLYYFTLSGFPGGLDYMALTLVKYNKINKLTEKKFSSFINAYVRMPLGTISTFYTYTAAINEQNNIKFIHLNMMAFLVFMNVSFFGKLAIENYGESKHLLLR